MEGDGEDGAEVLLPPMGRGFNLQCALTEPSSIKGQEKVLSGPTQAFAIMEKLSHSAGSSCEGSRDQHLIGICITSLHLNVFPAAILPLSRH